MQVEHSNNCGIITLEEKALIVNLRQEIEGELPLSITSLSVEDQDLFLVRWLRARDLHLEKSVNMLRTSLQWRKEKNADEWIKFKVDPFFHDNYPSKFAGTDKLGQPVILVPLADWDFRKVVNNPERLSEFDDFVIFFFEVICNHIKEAYEKGKGKKDDKVPVTQAILLIDVEKYPYSQLIHFGAIKKILQLAKTYEAYYPEYLHKVIFISCPSYFGMFIGLLRQVIPPKTMEKIKCFSKMSDWQNNINELMDAAQIPERYGGLKAI